MCTLCASSVPHCFILVVLTDMHDETTRGVSSAAQQSIGGAPSATQMETYIACSHGRQPMAPLARHLETCSTSRCLQTEGWRRSTPGQFATFVTGIVQGRYSSRGNGEREMAMGICRQDNRGNCARKTDGKKKLSFYLTKTRVLGGYQSKEGGER